MSGACDFGFPIPPGAPACDCDSGEHVQHARARHAKLKTGCRDKPKPAVVELEHEIPLQQEFVGVRRPHVRRHIEVAPLERVPRNNGNGDDCIATRTSSDARTRTACAHTSRCTQQRAAGGIAACSTTAVGAGVEILEFPLLGIELRLWR